MLSVHSAPQRSWGGKGTGFLGSLWATENPVTRFPLGKGGAVRHQKGGPLFHRPPGRLYGFIIMAPLHFQREPHHGLRPLSDSDATLGPCVSTGPYAPLPRSGRPLREYRLAHQPTSTLVHYFPTKKVQPVSPSRTFHGVLISMEILEGVSEGVDIV